MHRQVLAFGSRVNLITITPNNPDEPRKQIEGHAREAYEARTERTAESEEVRTTKRGEFFKIPKRPVRRGRLTP